MLWNKVLWSSVIPKKSLLSQESSLFFHMDQLQATLLPFPYSRREVMAFSGKEHTTVRPNQEYGLKAADLQFSKV